MRVQRNEKTSDGPVENEEVEEKKEVGCQTDIIQNIIIEVHKIFPFLKGNATNWWKTLKEKTNELQEKTNELQGKTNKLQGKTNKLQKRKKTPP